MSKLFQAKHNILYTDADFGYSEYSGKQLYSGGRVHFTVAPDRLYEFAWSISDNYKISLIESMSVLHFVTNTKGDLLKNLHKYIFSVSITGLAISIIITKDGPDMNEISKEKLQAIMEANGFSYFNFVTSFKDIFDTEDELLKRIGVLTFTFERDGIKDISVSVGV